MEDNTSYVAAITAALVPHFVRVHHEYNADRDCHIWFVYTDEDHKSGLAVKRDALATAEIGPQVIDALRKSAAASDPTVPEGRGTWVAPEHVDCLINGEPIPPGPLSPDDDARYTRLHVETARLLSDAIRDPELNGMLQLSGLAGMINSVFMLGAYKQMPEEVIRGWLHLLFGPERAGEYLGEIGLAMKAPPEVVEFLREAFAKTKH